MHYSDDSPLEIIFDERGRPVRVIRQLRTFKPGEQTGIIHAVRERAALLRSHALAASAAREHRQATGG